MQAQGKPEQAKTAAGGEKAEEGQSPAGVSVFVGNLAFSTREEGLRRFFEKVGRVRDVRLAKNYDGRSKGFAFVEFEDRDTAEKAAALSGSDLDGRPIRCDIEESRGSGQRGGDRRQGGDRDRDRDQGTRGGDSDSSTVFVGNLAFGTKEDTLRRFFEKAGSISDVRLARTQDGASKGFGYVEFADAASAKKAVALNGTEIDGRQIKVDLDDRTGGRRQGGGRGGYGERRGRGGYGGGRDFDRGYAGRGGRGYGDREGRNNRFDDSDD